MLLRGVIGATLTDLPEGETAGFRLMVPHEDGSTFDVGTADRKTISAGLGPRDLKYGTEVLVIGKLVGTTYGLGRARVWVLAHVVQPANLKNWVIKT